MPDGLEEYIESINEQEEAEYASYLATMEGERYEIDGQTHGEPRTSAKAAEAVGEKVFERST